MRVSAAVGGLLLLLGMLGGVLKERRPGSKPFIALLAGVLIGLAVFGPLDLAELGNETVIIDESPLVTPGVALRLPVVVLTGTRKRFCPILRKPPEPTSS